MLRIAGNWPPDEFAAFTSCDTGRENYNFPTSHHATRKTQTQTPMANNTGITVPLIPPIETIRKASFGNGFCNAGFLGNDLGHPPPKITPGGASAPL